MRCEPIYKGSSLRQQPKNKDSAGYIIRRMNPKSQKSFNDILKQCMQYQQNRENE